MTDEVLPVITSSTWLLVVTGAGISAESGLATFRGGGGLWEGHRVEDVATPDAFRRNPALVWRFYSERRRQAMAAEPNAAHHAVVDLEHLAGTRFLLVTQNVDGLHRRAGSRRGVEIHGSLWRSRCATCGRTVEDTSYPVEPPLPWCDGCTTDPPGPMRPDIVWFTEPIDMRVLEGVARFIETAGASGDPFVFLAVGTSGLVYPTAAFVDAARLAGAGTWCIALEPPANADQFDHVLLGPATRWLPAIVEAAAG